MNLSEIYWKSFFIVYEKPYKQKVLPLLYVGHFLGIEFQMYNQYRVKTDYCGACICIFKVRPFVRQYLHNQSYPPS